MNLGFAWSVFMVASLQLLCLFVRRVEMETFWGGYMPDKQILHYIKTEGNSELLYLIAVACLERLASLNKASAIKAVVDAATTTLFKMIKS